MAQQQTKSGGKKLRRCSNRSPSEERRRARGMGRPKKKVKGRTTKGNFARAPSEYLRLQAILWAGIKAKEAAALAKVAK